MHDERVDLLRWSLPTDVDLGWQAFANAWLWDGEREVMSVFDTVDPLRGLVDRASEVVLSSARNIGVADGTWEHRMTRDRILEMRCRIDHQAERFGYGPDMDADRLGRLVVAVRDAVASTAIPSNDLGVRWAQNEHYLAGLVTPPPVESPTSAGGWRPARDDLTVTHDGDLVTARVRTGIAAERVRRWSGTVCVNEFGYDHGLPDGVSRRFHPSGALASEMHFVGGLAHGPSTIWDAAGERIARATSILGRFEGRWECTHAGCVTKRSYAGGVAHGLETTRTPAGVVVERGVWADGLRTGEWESGRSRSMYVDGRPRIEPSFLGWEPASDIVHTAARRLGLDAHDMRHVVATDDGRELVVIRTHQQTQHYVVLDQGGSHGP